MQSIVAIDELLIEDSDWALLTLARHGARDCGVSSCRCQRRESCPESPACHLQWAAPIRPPPGPVSFGKHISRFIDQAPLTTSTQTPREPGHTWRYCHTGGLPVLSSGWPVCGNGPLPLKDSVGGTWEPEVTVTRAVTGKSLQLQVPQWPARPVTSPPAAASY